MQGEHLHVRWLFLFQPQNPLQIAREPFFHTVAIALLFYASPFLILLKCRA